MDRKTAEGLATLSNIVRELICIVTGTYPPGDENMEDTLKRLKEFRERR